MTLGIMQLVQEADEKDPRNGTLKATTKHRLGDCTKESTVQKVHVTEDGAKFTISRDGDLVSNVVLEIVMKKAEGASFFPAEHLLKHVELRIAGDRIDHFNNTWLRLYDELYRTAHEREAYHAIGNFETEDPPGTSKRFFVPLPFWFCREPESAFPMIALAYSNLDVCIDFESLSNIPGIDPTFRPQVSAYCDFLFPGDDQRRQLAQTPLKFLIEQHEVVSQPIEVGKESMVTSIPLSSINKPVKTLVCVLRPSDATLHGRFTTSGAVRETREVFGPVDDAAMMFHRFGESRKGSYYRMHAFETFGQLPSVGIYPISFSKNPRAIEPTGYIHFDSPNQPRLQLTTKAAVPDPREEHHTAESSQALQTVEVHACTYNVLHIRSGAAGLLSRDF